VPQLESYFRQLKSRGLHPESLTVDGNPEVIIALRNLWPEAVIQRCLVHIQRQGLSWCRACPKTSYARKLRAIFLGVTSITTQESRDAFVKDVMDWERQYGYWLDHQPERGRVFSDIKRARSMLLRALPDMFHYIDDPRIPSSTNGLESYFSRLKSHYRQHRGLSKEKRCNYFNWYIYYVPR
jgi:transposase-like protein